MSGKLRGREVQLPLLGLGVIFATEIIGGGGLGDAPSDTCNRRALRSITRSCDGPERNIPGFKA
jgi:hypothetical protein